MKIGANKNCKFGNFIKHKPLISEEWKWLLIWRKNKIKKIVYDGITQNRNQVVYKLHHLYTTSKIHNDDKFDYDHDVSTFQFMNDSFPMNYYLPAQSSISITRQWLQWIVIKLQEYL